MKIICITGAMGFIGKSLTRKLLSEGYIVYAIDNFSTSSKESLIEFNKHDKFYFIEKEIEHAIIRCHFIINLGASVGVKYIEDSPVDSVLNNVNSMLKIFEYCTKYNKPILQASTSEVYGNSIDTPFDENQDLQIGPSHQHRWSYATTKLLTEQLLLMGNFPATIVRFFNIVGPEQVSDYGMVMPSFIEKALNDEDITIYGDGNQTRCFCSIDSCVEMLYRLIKDKSLWNEVYNIGNPDNEIRICNLATKIIKETNSNSKIIFKPYNKEFSKNSCDIIKRVPNIDKITKAINYTPTCTIDSILRQIVYSKFNKI